ncbi:helix-turn-helix transcriptional regulator [Herpetosiphon geysericola]|uniref:helix-turn-helix transcriptional regulator n=1 Tax=Herpetosiphon geysericola TaxID=70996 RepID=UPI00128F8205|nr:MarR family transcriptional regulator [Herpetosiphon geysericola]
MKNKHTSDEITGVVPTPEVSTNVVYRSIVSLYRAGTPVTQALIVRTTGLSKATVSRHVSKLRGLNRINIERSGRTTILQPKEA